MIALWFILGTALILGIARYNESNRLFWILLFAFIMGFAGTKMILDTCHRGKQSNDSLTQVCPTQVSNNALFAKMQFNTSADMTLVKVTALNPVSKDYTPVQSETSVTLSEVFERTRDQPIFMPIKPPEYRNGFFDTS